MNVREKYIKLIEDEENALGVKIDRLEPNELVGIAKTLDPGELRIVTISARTIFVLERHKSGSKFDVWSASRNPQAVEMPIDYLDL